MINRISFAFEKKCMEGINIYENFIILQLTVIAQMPVLHMNILLLLVEDVFSMKLYATHLQRALKIPWFILLSELFILTVGFVLVPLGSSK